MAQSGHVSGKMDKSPTDIEAVSKGASQDMWPDGNNSHEFFMAGAVRPPNSHKSL